MGFLDLFRPAKALQLVNEHERTAARFAVDSTSVPASFFGLDSYSDPVAVAGRVSRRVALQVPAIKRGLALTAGVAGRTPLLQFDGGGVVPSRLLSQPERGIPRSVTMTRTFTDLMLDGVAWWLVTAYDWQNRPAEVIRLDPWSVSLKENGEVFYTLDGNSGSVNRWTEDVQLIRFDSPEEPILVAGARAIRTLLLLDQAAENAAEGVPPQDYFEPDGDTDPFPDTDTETSEEQVSDFLAMWATARKTRRTAYIPASLKYATTTAFSPEQLQLIESRQHAITEIARLFGVDTEELGVSTTSRTYFNAYDRRKNYVDFTLATLLAAVEDRLSMNDVTTSVRYVRADLDALLRSDPAARMTIATQGLTGKVFTQEEARTFFDPQLPEVASEDAAIAEATDPADQTPTAPQEATA